MIRSERLSLRSRTLHAEAVADAANGHDVARILWVIAQAIAQRGEVRFDRAAAGSVGVPPHFSQQHVARYDMSSMANECGEQVELLGPQAQCVLASANDTRREVDAQIAEVDGRSRLGTPSRSLEESTHASEELTQAARLDDVVIRSEVEPAELFLLGAARGHD